MRFLDAISNPYVSRFLLSSGLGMMSGQNIGSSMLAGLGSADEERQRRLREELARKEMELKKKQQESYEELRKIQQESLEEQRRASRERLEEGLELRKDAAETKEEAIERDTEEWNRLKENQLYSPKILAELYIYARKGNLEDGLDRVARRELSATRMDIGYQAGLTGARAGASEGVKGTVRAEQSREDLFDEELADIKTNTRIEMLNDPRWKDRPFDPEFSIELTRRAVRALYREKGWAPKKYDEYLGIAVRKPRMVGSVPPDMEWETWR